MQSRGVAERVTVTEVVKKMESLKADEAETVAAAGRTMLRTHRRTIGTTKAPYHYRGGGCKHGSGEQSLAVPNALEHV